MTMNVLWLPWNLVYLTLYESSKRRLYRHYLRKRQAEEGAAAPAAVVTCTAEGACVHLQLSCDMWLGLCVCGGGGIRGCV